MAQQAEPFYHKLYEEYAVHSYENDNLPFLEIKNSDYKAKFISFKDSSFSDLVHFDNTNLSIGLYFENCTFKKPLVFTNVSANGYDEVLNGFSHNLYFKNCSFNDGVKFRGVNAEIERSVVFEHCTFLKAFEVEYLKINTEGLKFQDCNFQSRLDLFNVYIKQDILLSNNSFNSFIRIESSICEYLSIVGNNVFKDNFHIRGGVFNRGILLNDGVFKKEVYIYQATSLKTGLTIIGSVFEKAVFVKYHRGKSTPQKGLYSFYFSDAKFINGIYVDGTEDLFADNPFVESIEISISAELKGDIVFRNLHLGILSISGYNNSANIFLEHLYINQIKIKGLINNAGLVFSMIKASHEKWFNDEELTLVRDNALYIDDSNFGKAQFFQVDFSSFNRVVFHNNILTDITTSLVKWFTPNQLDAGDESTEIKIYKDAIKSKDIQRIQNQIFSLISTYRSKQEIYRQLKFASQKQGDIPQSLEFQRHEMNYYRKITNLRKPRVWSEWLILWSSQSNNFGQNWLKALGLLLCFSFLFYIPIGFLLSDKLDYTHFATSLSDIGLNLKVIFCDNLKLWLVTLNPTHSTKDISDNISKYSSWFYLWDILSRVIVSYFIFQIIFAFRKFNK